MVFANRKVLSFIVQRKNQCQTYLIAPVLKSMFHYYLMKIKIMPNIRTYFCICLLPLILRKIFCITKKNVNLHPINLTSDDIKQAASVFDGSKFKNVRNVRNEVTEGY